MSDIEKKGGINYLVSSYPSILESNSKVIEPNTLPDFILYIKRKFNIMELDENNSKIEEMKKSEILMITSNTKVLFLKLDEEKNKAILYTQNDNIKEIIFNFDLEKFEDIYVISEFIPQTIEQEIISRQGIIEREFKEICLPKLIFSILENHYRTYRSFSQINEDMQDYILLASNHEFMKNVKKIKHDFDSKFDLFRSMASNISLHSNKYA